MTAAQLSMLISLVSNGAGWLAQEIAIARQEGQITDEQFNQLLDEAQNSDERVRRKYEEVSARVKGTDSGSD